VTIIVEDFTKGDDFVNPSLTDLGASDAYGAIADFEPRAVRVVECRFFAGLSVEETAETLGTSVRTVKRDWLLAKAWLYRSLEGN
jgi:DNA-directed RNA polymerase specialized sigma24 family protein